MVHVRYRCTACGKYGHRRNTCKEWAGEEAEGPRFVDKSGSRVKVDDGLWLQEQAVLEERLRRECEDILRLEELVGHKQLEAESAAAGLEYHRFGVADVDSDQVRQLRVTKDAERIIEKMQRGEL